MEVERAYLALAKAMAESPIVPPCTNTDPDLWFPEVGHEYRAGIAKKYCKLCPAKKECAEYAMLSNELYGIWGGTSRNDRLKMRRERGLVLLESDGSQDTE
jgi:WhiB family redox-sensing transcriptional regulator